MSVETNRQRRIRREHARLTMIHLTSIIVICSLFTAMLFAWHRDIGLFSNQNAVIAGAIALVALTAAEVLIMMARLKKLNRFISHGRNVGEDLN